MQLFEQFADYLVKSDVVINLVSFELQFQCVSIQSFLAYNAFETFATRFCHHLR